MKLILLTILLLIAELAYGQFNMEVDHTRLFVASNHMVTNLDYLMGLDFGVITPRRELAFYGVLDFRPTDKKVQEYQGNNLFIQYDEVRFLVGIGTDYMRSFSMEKIDNKGFYIGVIGAYTKGEYGGSIRQPDPAWVFIPRGGLLLSFFNNTQLLKVGYQYLDMKSADNNKHWVTISYSFMFF